MRKWMNPYHFKTIQARGSTELSEMLLFLFICMTIVIAGAMFVTWTLNPPLIRAIIFLVCLLYVPNIVAWLKQHITNGK
jgi:Flp pilus assembly protein TadB